ncbi:substrate-binding periplasmic protein [Pseudomonas vanderleydeniana]|uniref:Transporter substrate-binding domain-containing protein n=1 Tax=Pseudomonas vanderleydeniana TaxID=2745495 RepID=A0A9E6PHL2_9PSED|nr:transporter substrate-binding domain-containing protein [Pseudomonas vanderleydeniana]QXI26628.1 transporter substrate-binding domain-containing protein [Pseudomonas vanderleydeniana]
MARPFIRTLGGGAACLATALALLAQPYAHAETATWENAHKTGVLRCGAAVAAPYVMRDPATGQYSGYFVDLCRDFAEHVLKVKAQFVDTSWDNQVAGLQSGKWDMAMALNKTPERAQAVAFSVPATDYQISLLINEKNPKFSGAGNSLADYDKAGVTIAVISGTAADKAVSAAVKRATLMRLPGSDETRMALMSRRADVLADANDTNHLFAMANSWTREVLPVPALAKQGVSFALPLGTPAEDLAQLDAYLTQRRESGEIDKLVDKASAEIIAGKKAQ